METRHGLVARGDGETTQGDSEMDVVAKVPVTSSPAAEKVEEQSDIRTRILASFQEVDKNSDRDDASSVRSRESLDLLGGESNLVRYFSFLFVAVGKYFIDDLDPTSNMGGSQKDLHMLASSEDVVESEPGSKLPGVSLCAHPSEVTLADCQGDPPPPLHLVGEPLRLEVSIIFKYLLTAIYSQVVRTDTQFFRVLLSLGIIIPNRLVYVWCTLKMEQSN